MTLATLSEVLQPALAGGYAVAGLVTLGWEDMRAYVAAAEAENLPVILQAGPSCRVHTPLPILGTMFRHLAEHATVPVVNGLTDLSHPCQVMADIMTVEEHLGTIEGKTVVMVGDGNNLANSWLNAAIVFPFNFVLACPEGYTPDEGIMKKAEAAGASFMITHDPKEAVEGAHVIYSDAFYSMGQEEEAVRRRQDFAPFQITTDLLSGADEKHIVLHCLPAHRGEEITDEVMDGPHSVVFDEAENRMHAQRAILASLIQ